MKTESKQKKRLRRHKRIRAKVSGTIKQPRLCVNRSSKHIRAQIIDDEKGKTLVAASDQELKSKTTVKEQKDKKEIKKGKIAIAYKVGKLIAEKAIKKKISKVIFDRGGYKYHGRVKSLAEGAREGGLKF